MAVPTLHSLVHHLQRLAVPDDAGRLTDSQLLERFAFGGDEAAFAVLVRRHGPMVLRACRRELGHEQDAEDVFQATFLVLARKAMTVCWRPSITGWLFATAYRLAQQSKRSSRRRQERERKAATNPVQPPPSEVGRRELETVLDEELARLPERYRSAVLLCVLDGQTREEAARQLGCGPRSVKHRVERGRDLLRRGLARRGWDLSTALLVAAVGGRSADACPAALATRTARAAHDFLRCTATSTTVSAAARALAEGALTGASLGKGLFAVAVLLLTLGGSLAFSWFPNSVWEPPPRNSVSRLPEDAKQSFANDVPKQSLGTRPTRPVVDAVGDPLPANALLRFGTVRFRHGNGIQAIALSPDGKTLATAGGDEGFATIQLMDAASGRVRHVIRGVANDSSFGDGRCFLAISPDSKTLATAGKDGVARLYDLASGKPVGQFRGRDMGGSVSFSPDGKVLAVGGLVQLWDVAAGKELWTKPSARGYVLFCPDGKTLAVVGVAKGEVAFLDRTRGEEVRRVRHGADVCRAAFSPDGKLFATTGADHRARVWDTAGGKERFAFEHPLKNGHNITAVVFSPDSKRLATGASDNLIRLWDLQSGKETHTLKGHGWWITGLAYAPDGRTLFSGSWDATVRRWDVRTGKEVAGPEGYTHDTVVAFAANGSRLAVAGGGGGEGIHLCDGTGRRLKTIGPVDVPISSLALSADGRRLASAHRNGSVRLWDAGSGRLVRSLAEGVKGDKIHPIAALVFSPDGRHLAAAETHHEEVVHVWSLGEKGGDLKLAHSGPSALAFSPDGRTLATGGWDHMIRLWDAGSGKKIAEIAHDDIVDSLAFSPDGRRLASSHHHRRLILLWDVASRKLVRELQGHNGVVWSVAFSPDGLWLASGGLDRTIRLWDVAAGKEVLRREGHEGWVYQVAFGPRGRTLLSGSLDTTALLWDLRPPGASLPAEGAGKPWDVLAGDDPVAVYRAVWALVDDPKTSVPLLEQRLKRAGPVVEPGKLKGWLADLDSPTFAVREAATRELSKIAAAVEPELRKALKEKPSLEVRRRLEQVLETMAIEETRERLRERRAVAVLERLGTPEARRLLESLAQGAASAPLTRDARAALRR